MQTQGFMLAHNRPIIKGANKYSEDLAAENNWWADAGTWGNGTGYRRGASALDAKPFICGDGSCILPIRIGARQYQACPTLSDQSQGMALSRRRLNRLHGHPSRYAATLP